MTRGYRSWFQDLINVWKMPATLLKNKVPFDGIYLNYCSLGSYSQTELLQYWIIQMEARILQSVVIRLPYIDDRRFVVSLLNITVYMFTTASHFLLGPFC
jgi:hypothetical protein